MRHLLLKDPLKLHLLLEVYLKLYLALEVPLKFLVFLRARKASWTSLLLESFLVSMLVVKMLRIFTNPIKWLAEKAKFE
jgi:hypothetical protein